MMIWTLRLVWFDVPDVRDAVPLSWLREFGAVRPAAASVAFGVASDVVREVVDDATDENAVGLDACSSCTHDEMTQLGGRSPPPSPPPCRCICSLTHGGGPGSRSLTQGGGPSQLAGEPVVEGASVVEGGPSWPSTGPTERLNRSKIAARDRPAVHLAMWFLSSTDDSVLRSAEVAPGRLTISVDKDQNLSREEVDNKKETVRRWRCVRKENSL